LDRRPEAAAAAMGEASTSAITLGSEKRVESVGVVGTSSGPFDASKPISVKDKDAGNDEWAAGKWGAYADPSSKERSGSGKESSSGSAAAGGGGGGGGGSGGGGAAPGKAKMPDVKSPAKMPEWKSQTPIEVFPDNRYTQNSGADCVTHRYHVVGRCRLNR